MLHDFVCTQTFIFACDAPVMGNRVKDVETGLETVKSDVTSVQSDVAAVESDVVSVQTDLQSVEERASDIGWGQYIFNTNPMDWDTANEYRATTYGTTLATIKNDADALAMFEMNKHYGRYFWIGLRDEDGDGVYQWASGFPCDADCGKQWYTDNENQYSAGKCMYVPNDSTSYETVIRDYSCAGNGQFYSACDAPVLGNRVKDVEAGLETVESDVDVAESDIDSLESDVVSIQTSVSGVQSDISILESGIASIQSSITSIQTDLQSVEDRASAIGWGQ